jgi:multisubunit Na+/H+ antiporter MnhG subunit
MKKNKLLGIILVVIGVALLIGSAELWYYSLKSANPPDVGQTVRDWITTITGVISCIIGVLTYFKKDKKGD